eukprot:c3503_g1_i1.p1 GENE.c3503_g1_i1~~c3503_g1_i1.p1  ORF type:complete len:286 (+),score=72.16 c3503_g1_i1:82-939(+)
MSESNTRFWVCAACTLHNQISNAQCEVCETAAPTSPHADCREATRNQKNVRLATSNQQVKQHTNHTVKPPQLHPHTADPKTQQRHQTQKAVSDNNGNHGSIIDSSPSLTGSTPLIDPADDSDMIAMMGSQFIRLDADSQNDDGTIVVLPDDRTISTPPPATAHSSSKKGKKQKSKNTHLTSKHNASKDSLSDDDWEVFDKVDDDDNNNASFPSKSVIAPPSPVVCPAPTPEQAQSIEWWQAENQKLHHKIALLQQFAKSQVQRTDQVESELCQARAAIKALQGGK